MWMLSLAFQYMQNGEIDSLAKMFVEFPQLLLLCSQCSLKLQRVIKVEET